jgi:hypothetical protein
MADLDVKPRSHRLGVAVRTLQFLPLHRELRLLWNKIVSQMAPFDLRVEQFWQVRFQLAAIIQDQTEHRVMFASTILLVLFVRPPSHFRLDGGQRSGLHSAVVQKLPDA